MYIVYNKDTGEIYSFTEEKPIDWTKPHLMAKIQEQQINRNKTYYYINGKLQEV